MNRKGFSIIKLVAVMLIIGLLAAVVIPKFIQNSKQQSVDVMAPKTSSDSRLSSVQYQNLVGSSYTKVFIITDHKTNTEYMLVKYDTYGCAITPMVKQETK